MGIRVGIFTIFSISTTFSYNSSCPQLIHLGAQQNKITINGLNRRKLKILCVEVKMYLQDFHSLFKDQQLTVFTNFNNSCTNLPINSLCTYDLIYQIWRQENFQCRCLGWYFYDIPILDREENMRTINVHETLFTKPHSFHGLIWFN